VPVGIEHIPGLAEALAARTDTGVAEAAVAEVDASVLERYAGNYKLEAYDVVIKVSWNGEQLMFEMPGQPVAELLPSSETEFFIKIAPTTLPSSETEFFIKIAPTTFSFFMNEDGSVSHMILDSSGTQTRVNRVD